jgi:hypothetical protein
MRFSSLPCVPHSPLFSSSFIWQPISQTYRRLHTRRTYHHICIIGDIWSNKINSGMYVMPEGLNADAALHRGTGTFGRMNTNNAHLSNQINKRIVSCKSAILLIRHLARCPRYILILSPNSRLVLLCVLFPWNFQMKTVFTFLSSAPYMLHTNHPSWFNLHSNDKGLWYLAYIHIM